MTRPILTAAETRAAEEAAISAGTSVETLMDRAGIAAAEAIWRYAGRMPTLVLCGPGNNGGDGYVVARALAARGADIRVAALAEPATPAGNSALRAWGRPVARLEDAAPAALLVDALFGTGLSRPLDASVSQKLASLSAAARVRAALDLPSGVSTDDGAILSPPPTFDLTIAFACLKPAHLLQPAAAAMGRVVVADIGVAATSALHALERPSLCAPGPADHKYTRGYVLVVAGAMPGAAALAASAALRAGAGYVRLLADGTPLAIPSAVVQSAAALGEALADPRPNCLLVGPGLGRGARARETMEAALASGRSLVLDGDGLGLIGEARIPADSILTPHAGEFARLFSNASGSKIEQARAGAAASGAVIVFKGADTVIAAPDGRAAIASGSPWLATAGTGDVLAGVIAAMRAHGLGAFEAACAGVWLHGRAADLAGSALIADDLAPRLAAALAECL